jgi:phosphoribosyl 1,2-cyclic phosphodiesterase
MTSARFVFLGTGTSERVPRVTCLAKPEPECIVCMDSQRPGSKNYRRNTSLLVQTQGDNGQQVNIVIDAGKSFYEACLEWFPKYDTYTLDAVVITHAHADAIAGLDDLRDWTNNARESIPVYVRAQDMPTISLTHFYLVDRSRGTSAGGIAKLDFIETTDQPFDVYGTKFTPLNVQHGRAVTSNGYRIGDVCYIPDASTIPPSTIALMEGCRVLVLDALRPGRTHGSHLTLEQAVDIALEVRAEKTLFTDMAHDIDHEPVNAELAKMKKSYGLDIQLAYDGLAFESEL